VSHELARRNEQLKKDFANETTKYRTLVLAFEDLFLEYKDLLDVHGLMPTLFVSFLPMFHHPSQSLLDRLLSDQWVASNGLFHCFLFPSIHFLLGERKPSQVSHLS
jgi:hypothetical protein